MVELVWNRQGSGLPLSGKVSANGKSSIDRLQAGASRKLTKNEKRRQKNKQKRADARVGDATEKIMLESNGVAVASWPPPEEPKPSENDVQVCRVSCVLGYLLMLLKITE